MDDGFFGLLRRRFEPALDRPFLRVPGGGAMTYRDMDQRSARTAEWLRNQGVSTGDRVVAQLPKSVDAIALYLGVLRLGAVHVPLNTAYTPTEVDRFVADAEPAAVVQNADSVLDGLNRSQPLDCVVERNPEDLAALVYTSGTTGRPKGAMLTHGNLASNALTLERAWAFQRTDVLMHTLPIFHVHGLMVALHTAMLSACEVIFLERFDAGEVLANLPSATVMMGVPTHYSRLVALEAFDATACSRIRLLISGSAPMPARLHRAVARRTGCRVLERYGMSEALMITSNPYDGDRVAGTVGFALPGIEVRVCADDGARLVGRAGMVQVRGPNVGPGYWRQPDATAESRTTDGWFITGDVGRLDGGGRLTLEGRATDMIISGGINVYPLEMEQILDSHPAVAESAVVGLPHPDLGEAVTAFVVREPGIDDTGDDLASELVGTLAEVARFKHPKRFVTVGQLPRNSMGKILKAELRARYADLFLA